MSRCGLTIPLISLIFCLIPAPAPRAEERSAGSTATLSPAVRPLVSQYCIKCHGPDSPEAGVNLSPLADGEPLNEHTARVGDAITQLRGYMMPPPSRKAQPTEEQRQSLLRELSGVLDRIDAGLPPFAGPAAVRRLNQREYTNAVRDLLGFDADLTTELPADDSAHGFDNVAEGLSLSPLAFEKYFAAAEEVLSKVAPGAAGSPTLNAEFAGACLGAPADRFEGDAVVLPLGKKEASAGAVIAAPRPGDYEVAVRAAKQGGGAQPATLTLVVDGVDSKVWTVYAPPERPVTQRVVLRLPQGEHKLQLRHAWYTAQADKDPPPSDLAARLEAMTVRGPLPQLAYDRLFVQEPGGGVSPREAAGRVVGRFAARAFRRPLDAGELDRLLALYDRARAAGRPHGPATRLVLASVLVSPHFLFHVVRDDTVRDPFGNVRLNDFELANRLSFFLWSAPPDDTLLDLAGAGRLHEDDTLRAQVGRMLADRKSAALAENFGSQWLGTRRLETLAFDHDAFPQFDDELRRSMAEEVRLVFQTVVDEDRSVCEFLTADWTWMNEDLARLYGQRGVRGGHMRRVALGSPNRGGVLTMPAILAVTSHPTRTSAVKRGKWILDEILGAPPPPPPPTTPALPAHDAGGTPRSYRERMQQHRADPRCFGCHVQMDALGLGLENFDAIGRWRDRDAGLVIDAAGTMPDGKSFGSPAELRRLLSQRRGEFVHCLTEKMFVYALGGGLQRGDRREVERVSARLSVDDRFSTLVTEIALSYPFRYRQPEPHEDARSPRTVDGEE